MDREKQVEEIDELTTVLYEANHKKSVLDYRWLATEAYNAGYRKARKNHTGTDKALRSIDYRPVEEVRRETAKEILQEWSDDNSSMGLDNTFVKNIAKKYGVEVEE